MSPAKTNKTAGVIGLGIMGGSFSRNLVKELREFFGPEGDSLRYVSNSVAASSPAASLTLPTTRNQIASTSLLRPMGYESWV